MHRRHLIQWGTAGVAAFAVPRAFAASTIEIRLAFDHLTLDLSAWRDWNLRDDGLSLRVDAVADGHATLSRIADGTADFACVDARTLSRHASRSSLQEVLRYGPRESDEGGPSFQAVLVASSRIIGRSPRVFASVVRAARKAVVATARSPAATWAVLSPTESAASQRATDRLDGGACANAVPVNAPASAASTG